MRRRARSSNALIWARSNAIVVPSPVVLVVGRDVGRGREHALQVTRQLAGLHSGGGPVGGQPCADRRVVGQARPRWLRYRAISAFVEESWSPAGASAWVSSGASWFAITLPSSTPHWSNGLMPQMVPSVKTMCS